MTLFNIDCSPPYFVGIHTDAFQDMSSDKTANRGENNDLLVGIVYRVHQKYFYFLGICLNYRQLPCGQQ